MIESLGPSMLLQMALFHPFSWLSNIPLSVCVCVCVCVCVHTHTHYIFFIHSSADGHLGFLYMLAIVTSAAMNMGVHVSF